MNGPDVKHLLVLFALAVSGAAAALSTDKDQPIHIEADRAEADNAKRETVYYGDVVITQGTLKITGETVTIHYDEHNDVSKIISEGKPARFRQLPDGAPDLPENYQTAKAARMEYYAQKDLIVLLGDAVYGQGGDRIAADRIVYDSLKSRMRADSRATAGEEGQPPSRVRIKIEPKKSE